MTEWINPPLIPGVEYRTVERFNGNPVYIKALSCGAMPSANSSKQVKTEFTKSITSVVDYGGWMSVSGSTPASLPYDFSDTNYAKLGVSYNRVIIFSGSTDLTAYNQSFVWFKYTV